jgi:predicted nucleic acid-binding Zn ribbon protein
MPTYEFRCPDGSIIEARFKISEVPESIPTPDGTGVATRIISGGASLLFKGSGFYITDYGKDGKKDQRTGGASAAEGGSSSDSKSDSKSDSSSSAKPAASAPSASSSSTSSSE